jgi:hypothetical protein
VGRRSHRDVVVAVGAGVGHPRLDERTNPKVREGGPEHAAATNDARSAVRAAGGRSGESDARARGSHKSSAQVPQLLPSAPPGGGGGEGAGGRAQTVATAQVTLMMQPFDWAKLRRRRAGA